MSLQYVQHICDANNIELCLGWKSYLTKEPDHDPVYIAHQYKNSVSSAISVEPLFFGILRAKRYIVLGLGCTWMPHEISAWHELGHHMGELSKTWGAKTSNFTSLDFELDANLWVMENYIGNFSHEFVAKQLREAILTYIVADYNTAHRRYLEVARWLSVDHLINWVD